tara:strand:- start:1747 stop:2100 length:354 start_codon:yes stop_codon:yes gene_type:complete
MLGFILLIIAILMSVILFPLGWLYSLFTFKLSIRKLSGYFKAIAISIDQLGNVVMANLMNDTLIKDNGHKFGDPDETISMVLGLNKREKSLTNMGIRIADILNKIEKDHVEKAIEKR